MSRCISAHGEYSSHELVNDRCEWCRVWQCPTCDEDLPYPLDSEDHDCLASVDCVVPGHAHDDQACITEAESKMGLDEFMDHLVANEGMDPKDANRYRKAIRTAVGADEASQDAGTP